MRTGGQGQAAVLRERAEIQDRGAVRMRTGGQGQAAVLRERADRRRAPLSAWTGTLGRWEKIRRTVTDLWSAIQRLSLRRSMPAWGGCLAFHGRVPRSWLFVCANVGRAGPDLSQTEGKEK